MGAKFSVAGLLSAKTALLKGGKSRTDALTALLEWSKVEENRLTMGSELTGLLPLLKDIAIEGGPEQNAAVGCLLNLSWTKENRPYMASPSLGLLSVLKDTLGIDAVRLSALKILRNLSICDGNEIPMAASELGLLPALNKVVQDGNREERVYALGVLQGISCAPVNMVTMASQALGLMPVLIRVVIGGEKETTMIALLVLKNLSCADANQVPMALKALGLLRVLMKVTREYDTELSFIALSILHNLSSAPQNQVPMASSSLELLVCLKEVFAVRSGRERVKALEVLQSLSIAPANKQPMASPDLDLLPALTRTVEVGDNEARIAALSVLHNLAVLAANKVAMALPALGLLPHLVHVLVSDVGDARTWALKVVSHLSLASDNHALMASGALGLVSVLDKLATAYDSKNVDAVKLIISIQRNLSNVVSTEAIEAAKVKVLAEYGVPLALFIACVQFRISVSDARIAVESESGSDQMEKAKLKSALGFASGLGFAFFTVLPQEFVSLDTQGQAQWINQKLHARTAQLMRASDDMQLVAFVQFLFSLPPNLRGNVGGTTCAVCTEHYVALIGDGGLSVVVDGLGSKDSAIKIKLKKDENLPVKESLLPTDMDLLPCLLEVIATTAGDTRASALHAILSFSSATNRSELRISDLGLADVLAAVLNENDRNAVVLSLMVFLNLSTIKIRIGWHQTLFLALPKILDMDDDEVALLALRILHNLPPSRTNQNSMVSFLAVLVKQLTKSSGEIRLVAIQILVRMSCYRECSAAMELADLGLIPVLKWVIESCEFEEQLCSLRILCDLSAAAGATRGFGDLSLLKTLTNVVASATEETREQALCIFCNLSALPELCVPMTSSDLGLLSILKHVLASCDDMLMLALCTSILQNLSNVAECSVLLGSDDLGLVPVLVSVVVRYNGEAKARALVILQRLLTQGVVCCDALLSLSAVLESHYDWKEGLKADLADQAAHAVAQLQPLLKKVTDMVLVVLAEQGMTLDLYYACVQYRFSLLDDQVENFSGKGPASVKLLGDLMEQRTQVESVCDQLHQLRVGLPPGFQALSSDSRRQAHWLQQELDSYSDKLMKNKKDLVLLRAFSKFHASLPAQLQEAQESPSPLPHQRSADAISATSNAAHALVTGNVTLDAAGSGCVVVDGTFCDGPMTTPVKIKLRSIEHSAMIHHEYSMLCKFHKHAPSAVVAPFALVSTADR